MSDFRVRRAHVLSVAQASRRGFASLAWIGFALALALSDGCTKADPFPAETAALQTLIDDYQLKTYKRAEDGHVIDALLEGSRFDDAALALVGKFPQMEGMSLQGSSVTDEGLEKLPVLKNLNRMNIIAPKITDRGLMALAKMPSLSNVWMIETPTLTAKGREALKKASPAVNLHVMNRPSKMK